MTKDLIKIAAIYVGFLAVLILAGWSATYDTSTPAGTDLPSVLDDRIREIKSGVQERLNVDHYWPLTGTQVSDADAGKHREVTFQGPLGAMPSLEPDEGYLGPLTVGGVTELHWKDENGNVKQLTNTGKLNVTATEAVLPTGDQTISGIKTFLSTPTFDVGFLLGQDTDVGNYTIRAKSFYADVPTGTAPLAVDSTTKVTNLNADQVDGVSLGGFYNSGWFAVTANTTYTKAHGLSAAPGIVCVWYSETADGSGDVVQVGGANWSYGTGASAVVVDVTAANVVIRVPSYAAYYVDQAGATQARASGYLKIVALGAF